MGGGQRDASFSHESRDPKRVSGPQFISWGEEVLHYKLQALQPRAGHLQGGSRCRALSPRISRILILQRDRRANLS